MTNTNADVRLVLLGAADAAPVCDGDVCYLPGSTVDLAGTLAPDQAGDEGADDQGGADMS